MLIWKSGLVDWKCSSSLYLSVRHPFIFFSCVCVLGGEAVEGSHGRYLLQALLVQNSSPEKGGAFPWQRRGGEAGLGMPLPSHLV